MNYSGRSHLGKISDIGPEGRRITRTYFKKSSYARMVKGMVALWDHKTDVTQGMAAKPDTHIIAKPEKIRT